LVQKADAAERENACAIRVVVLGKQAEANAQRLGRTSVVFIAGHLRQSERVTPEGEKRRTLEVVAERVEFLSEPAGRTGEFARAFIDPPAMLPETDPPAHVDESDPSSPDESLMLPARTHCRAP
jgi:single-stranded DNA-binding protein